MERLLARLERRFGRYALAGLTYYLVAAQAVVFVIEATNPGFTQFMTLDRDAVLHGQVWRLLTYLFIPPSSSPIWVLFALYWLYVMGTNLEAHWGAFRYQAYWITGMLSTTLFAFLLGVPATNVYLLMSLFLAFATLWPDYEILVFFILPVKVKWLALLDGVLLLALAGLSPGLQKLLPVFAVGNYLLYFAPTLIDVVRGGASRARRTKELHSFKRAVEEPARALRQCSLCGVTSADPNAEFRVCTCEKCGKPTEFCLPHARNH